MFEGSLVESEGLGVSETRRWSTVGSVMVQCLVAGAVVAIPLLHPEVLPRLVDAPQLVIPVPKPVVPPVQVEHAAAATSASVSVPVEMVTARSRVFTMGMPSATDDPGAPVGPISLGMGSSALPGAVVGTGGPGPMVTVAPAKKAGPVKLSSGVTEGMLLVPIAPVYPQIAVVARVQGAVVMEATISKTGGIESLRVVSGPMMLRQAAMSAVQAARYRPYRLNGEATEVQTTITVNFRLGS